MFTPQFLPNQEKEYQERNWAGLLLVEVQTLLSGFNIAVRGGVWGRGYKNVVAEIDFSFFSKNKKISKNSVRSGLGPNGIG